MRNFEEIYDIAAKSKFGKQAPEPLLATRNPRSTLWDIACGRGAPGSG